MKISLVMGTVNRLDEVARFLTYLEQQSYRNFEIIIVDSNKDNRLDPLIEQYRERFKLVHIKYYQPGVSRARNQGMHYATGDIIGFPDDDCWYYSGFLADLNKWFELNPDKHGLVVRAVSERRKTIGRYMENGKQLNRYDIWRCSATFTMFHRTDALPVQPVFKEYLGPGAVTSWGAAEDTQLLIDILHDNCTLIYNPDLTVFHPEPFNYSEEILIRRGYLYGAGLGYVMSINSYPLWFFIYYLLRCVVGIVLAAISFNRPKVRHYLQAFRGRLYGWKAGSLLGVKE